MSTLFRCSAILGTLLATSLVSAEPGALWLEPSTQWYGIDGNWSAISLYVGEPNQKIDVTVSTSLSEIWAVGKDGCSLNDTTCKTNRGGLYDESRSEKRQPLGTWRLGMEYLGLGGNGDYAMETVSVYDDKQKQQTSLTEQLVAGINDTDYYIGYFGLGVNDVRFKDVVSNGPIAVLAEKTVIGSQVYGYTAGAYYAGASGTPLSLTLGGYDENRFVSHNTLFTLNVSSMQPEVVITSITASISDAEKKPTSWPASSVVLGSDNDSTTALIDSSTPYLWLPTSICDRFAVAFNLTWNETFGLYLFSDDGLEKLQSLPDLSVAFTLSDLNSADDSTVTITISANAFLQYLRSPFMDLSSGTPAIPYFPLRRVNDGGKMVIGRTFMQETYLITNYETSTFSVHQATFPDNPFTNTSIKAVSPGGTGGPGSHPPDESNGLSTGQLAGIIVGACVVGVAITMLVWWLLSRRTEQRRSAGTEDPLKDVDSFTQPGSPKVESGGILSKISKSLPWSKSGKDDARGQFTPSPYPANHGTDLSHEGYWTPNRLPELDARRVRSMHGGAQFHPGSGEDMATYEIARMGLDPLPLDLEYDQPLSAQEQFHGTQDINTMAGQRLSSPDLGLHNLFPGSPTPDNFSDGSSSPMSPYGDPRYDWTAHNMPHYPSTQPLVNTQFATARSNSTLSSSSAEPHSALRSVSSHGSLAPPSPPVQRAPIDGSDVICLGPLPDNVQLPYPSAMAPPPPPPPAHHLYGDFFEPPPIPPSINYRRNRVSTAETLGSNYTVEEEARGRINGPDIVHIPHLPERRYSWEQ